MGRNSVGSNPKNLLVSIIILLAVVIMFAIMLYQGIGIKQDNDMLKVSGGLFYSAKVPYSEITSIELRDRLNSYGSRSNGASLLNYKLGYFNNDEFGKYKLFVDNSINKIIVLKYGENTVVFNGKNETTTVDIYNSLLEKSGLK